MRQNDSQELQLVLRAMDFAASKHRLQCRKDEEGTPYINHPIALTAVLSREAGIHRVDVLCAALLHDTIEDTDTAPGEIEAAFGTEICRMVEEVSDDKTLPKVERKRLQIEHAAHISEGAKLVKLADKICNLRDVANSPPAGWSVERKRAYFDWAKAVVDRLRGVHPGLESLFDQAYSARP